VDLDRVQLMHVLVSEWIDAPELQPEGREYAIGDVHGFAEPLESVLCAMGESAAKAGRGHLTFLGDLIDKGPDPAGALRLAVTTAEQWGFAKKTLLTGNHDLFLLLTLDDIEFRIRRRMAFLEIAELNGFMDTLDQLGVADLPSLRRRLVELLGEAGPAQIDGTEGVRKRGNITMSHAGPGWAYGIRAEEWFAQPPRFRGFIDGSEAHYTWTRFWWMHQPLDPGIFVHGHTPERLIRRESLWRPEIHRIDGQRLGLDGLGRRQSERFIVGAEMEPGRYRIYSAG
jgi:hypothetical protein